MGVFDSITFGWIDEAEVKLACDSVNEQLDISGHIREIYYLTSALHDVANLIPSAWDTTGGRKTYSRVLNEFSDLNCDKLSQAGATLASTDLSYQKISAYKSVRI